MANIKQPRLPEIAVATTRPVSLGPSTAEMAAQGIERLAPAIGAALGKAEGEEIAQERQDVVSAFEDKLLDISFEKLLQQERVGAQAEADGLQLSESQKQALTSAKSRARQIDMMEEQLGAADRATIERAAAFREFKAQHPELAPELRSFFKQQFGKGLLQSLQETEEDKQKAAEEARAEMKSNLSKVAEGLGFVTAGKTIPELQAMVGAYEQEMLVASAAARKADLLGDLSSIRAEERKQQEEVILEEGFKGVLINNQLHINNLLKDFDPKAADQESKTALLSELQIAKRAVEAQLQDTFQETDLARINARLKPILDGYDQAMQVVTGELDKNILTNNNKISLEAAMRDLHQLEGFSDTLARLQTFRNFPAELVSGAQRVDFSARLVQPMIQMLAQGVRNPAADPYGGLASMASPQQLVQQYRGLRDVAIAELGNDEAAQTLSDALQAWTNNFQRAPDEVPLGVYDALMDVTEKPEAIDILQKSPQLSDNIVNGFRSYTDRMRANLADNLLETLDERFKVFRTDKPNPVQAGFLLPASSVERFRPAVAAPTLMELVTPSVQSDGSIVFRADSPSARTNSQIQKRLTTLNKAFGKTFGRLSRSYAHIVNGNTDYQKAAQDLLTAPEWQNAGELFEAPETAGEEE